MMLIRELVGQYNYVALSVEFCGIAGRPIGTFRSIHDFHYQTMRVNTDILNIVQLGLTLCDKDGKTPDGVPASWQFNFKFDLDNEMYPYDSIDPLVQAGIDFNKTKEFGIEVSEFAELLIDSGLLLLPDVHWISYHAGYDFGFLVSCLTNKLMPNNENDFQWWLNTYFPNCYDIKYIAKVLRSKTNNGNAASSKLSLELLAEELGIVRPGQLAYGGAIQVGSLAVLTSLCFSKLKKIMGEKSFDTQKNIIFGFHNLGKEVDESVQMSNSGNGIDTPGAQHIPLVGETLRGVPNYYR